MALRHIAGPFKFNPPHVSWSRTFFEFNIFEDENKTPVMLSQGWTDLELQRGDHHLTNEQRVEMDKQVKRGPNVLMVVNVTDVINTYMNARK